MSDLTKFSREPSALLPMLTLVLWLGCVSVGVAGFLLPYWRPSAPVKTPPPVTVEFLDVELAAQIAPPDQPAPAPSTPEVPPPLPAAPALTPPPPLVAIAAPSPQIAFAVPVAAPARIMPVAQAAFRTVETPPVVETPSAPPAPSAPAPTPLVLGQGEGKQPAPEYPREALRQGQEGTVQIRFTVGHDGRVLAAEASSPSPWPLLNNSALRWVKSRWHFGPGPVRAYEVPIHFQLNK